MVRCRKPAPILAVANIHEQTGTVFMEMDERSALSIENTRLLFNQTVSGANILEEFRERR